MRVDISFDPAKRVETRGGTQPSVQLGEHGRHGLSDFDRMRHPSVGVRGLTNVDNRNRADRGNNRSRSDNSG